MYLRFLALGLIDLVAGGILFFNEPIHIKIIAIALLTKGAITAIKSIQH